MNEEKTTRDMKANRHQAIRQKGMLRGLLWAGLLSCMALFVACSSINCPLQNTVYTFYQIQNSAERVDTLRDTLWVYTYRANGTDTLLLNSAIGLTKFKLPISQTAPADTLFFIWNDGAMDVVMLEKTNTPHVESVECSAAYFHEITSVSSTHVGIDTIIINNPNVNYDASKPHFYIRFKDRP